MLLHSTGAKFFYKSVDQLYFKVVDGGAFQWGFVGLMADEFALTVEGGEEHAMATVMSGEKGLMIYRPGTLQGAAFCGSQSFNIAVFIETGPYKGRLVILFEEEGTIGNEIAFSFYMMHPGSIIGLPKFDGVTDGGF